MKKIIVKVDSDLEDLMPAYLLSRRKELDRLPALLEAGDFDAVWTIGHKLHGSGGGFGLDFVTEVGTRMEKSAKALDKTAVTAQAAELKDYFDSLEIQFVPVE